MTIAEYARQRATSSRSVRRGIEAGLIERHADGLIDSDQADVSWGAVRRAPRANGNGQAGLDAATARIARTAAQVRLQRAAFEALDARYHARAAALVIACAEARFALDILRRSPEGPAAAAFAEQLSIDRATAQPVLHDFVAQLLEEVGDLEAMAAGDVEAA